MASRSYLINSNDMSLMDKRNYRMTALAAGLQRCGEKGIGNINADIPGLAGIPPAEMDRRVATIKAYIETGKWPTTIDQRELAPLTDFVAGAPAAQDFWVTPALAVVGTVYTCLNALLAYTFPAGRLMVCYGVSVDVAVLPISRLIFRRGSAVGNIQAQFDMQPMGTRLETAAFFSEPVVIDPQDPFAIQVLCNIIAGATPVHIDNFLFEIAGTTTA
ncbi:unnamed protein product [marine sediment metagenome]|uniref:Uncharacterized protein n=2 Tax=marine sediment metagenome TaxID=412755 RepID=X1QTW9_9ZZZZ